MISKNKILKINKSETFTIQLIIKTYDKNYIIYT